MTLPRDRCRKRRYTDRIQALYVLAVLKQKGKQGHDECRAYQCSSCKGWHLTSQPRNTPRAPSPAGTIEPASA